MLENLPVFGICGWNKTGKTTLIEAVIPQLCKNGLKVAAFKHDVHGIDVDHPGKDSDRLFQSGADILLQGTQEELFRLHNFREGELAGIFETLSLNYDLILVEGYKSAPVPKVWLLGPDDKKPPANVERIVESFQWDSNRTDAFLSILQDWLPAQWTRTPLYGCVLIGGKSSRPGAPKHLLLKNGKTWLERTVELLEQVAERVVIVGTGKIPASLAGHIHLPDVLDAEGPLSGMLACMRWAPVASWLVAACDLPNISPDALKWLISTRAPGVWATLPKISDREALEPLLAHYDFRARPLLEKLRIQHDFSPAGIVSSSKVISPLIPEHLAASWENLNTENS